MDPSRATVSPPGDGASPPPPVFPAGLRILLVDDDATCLKIVAKMLRKCLYDVTTCSQAAVALGLLRRKKGWFDLVLSDVYMPDMDGFKLLEYIGLEMDLPVIMMSADDHKDVVMKGVTHGACDYIIKPVRMESLKNIWQHVVRKKRNELRELENSGSLEETDKNKRTSTDEGDNASSASGGSGRSEKRQRERKDEEGEEEVFDEHDDPSHSKKPRVVWSAELHQKFLTAVNQLGVDKAVPKKILELMNVAGLTRENVASHLQKYRLYLRRVSVPQNQGIFDAHYTSCHDATYNPVGSVDGFNLQGLGAPAPLPPQSFAALNSGQRIATSSRGGLTAVDQLGCIGTSIQVTGASNIISSSLQQMNNQRINGLHGRSKNIELSQLGQSQQVVQPHGSISLQFGEGTPNFLILPSLVATTVSSPGGTNSGRPMNKPLSMHMTQHNHGQQFSVFQQRSCTLDIGLPGQPQLRGQLLNEVASHNPRLVSTITQQTPPNDIANQLVGRLGTNANTLASLPSNYINAPYSSAIPQTLYFEGQTNFTNRSTGTSYPPVSVTADTPQIGSFTADTPQVGSYDPFTNSSSLKGINHHVSGFDTIEEHQNGNQGWTLQKVNISYQSDQTLGLEQNTIDCHASRIGHQNAVDTANNGVNIDPGALTEELLSMRNKIDDKTSTRHNNTNLVENSAPVNYEITPDICYQNLFLGDNFVANELMNVVQEQRQDGIGQADAEFNIPV